MRQPQPESNTKRNYGFLIRSLHTGGAERQLVMLARTLANRGHGVEVITFYPGGEFEQQLRGSKVKLISLGKKGRWDVVGFSFRLLGTLRASGAEVMVGFLEVANIFLVASKRLLPGKTVVNRLAATYMDVDQYDWLSRLSFNAEIRFARFADLVITNSKSGKTRAQRAGVGMDKVVVVPNAIDADYFCRDETSAAQLRELWGVAESARIVGMVARLDPMKDHPTFIAAARQILAGRDNIKFICIGGGVDQNYIERIKECGRDLMESGRLLFLGPRSDLPALYSAMDINVLASYGEGSPNTVLEAMACETTCVVTNVGNAATLVGDTGRVVACRDAGMLADGILDQLDRIGRCPELGHFARQRILASHSTDQVVNCFQSALHHG